MKHKSKLKKKEIKENLIKEKLKSKKQNGITLIALVITIVLNCSYLAMEWMNKIEKI